MPSNISYDVARIQILALYDSYKNEGYPLQCLVTVIKDILHCTRIVPSGMASSEASFLKPKKYSIDHYFGRTRSAHAIVRLLDKGILSKDKPERFVAFIKSRSRVHYVTKSQNKALSSRDPNPGHWSNLYKKAGIRLVPYQGTLKHV